jgi:ribonuclease VapC
VNSTIEVVLDSSALMALMNSEPGGALVEDKVATAGITTVNVCEIATKLVSGGMPLDAAITALLRTRPNVLVFDQALAFESAGLVSITKPLGLSLGDRACLAAGRIYGVPVLTADKAWKKLAAKLGIDIRVIR